jgi:NAD(P)-dependent dehydrogenase (short-subunit alcohol dehydrogenase family)
MRAAKHTSRNCRKNKYESLNHSKWECKRHIKGKRKSAMNITYDFKGKVAIVTGSASGLGETTVRAFAKAGAKVVVADYNEEKGNAVCKSIQNSGAEAIFVKVDVTSQEPVDNLFKATLDAFGALDILVNNAGKGGPHLGNPLTRTDDFDWNTCYETMVRGTFHCCKASYNYFKEKKQGKIVNIASIAGYTGDPTLPHYSAAKAGIINFTQTLGRELAPFNINVNAVNPGIIYTPIWQGLAWLLGNTFPELYPNMKPREIFLANIDKFIPMKREQTPEDIANMVMFLAADEAKNITAQVINVDGGCELK